MKETLLEKKERASKVLTILKELYPNIKPALNYSSAFELLIATILSAQCTDERVNMVTRELFIKYKTPDDFIVADINELEKDIFSTGFYKNKAKNIKECCRMLKEKFNSSVPNEFEKLNELPGVGRKTASVVAGNAFGIPAIAVDTHVKRLSDLLDFANSNNPEKIEQQLKEILPPEIWVSASHLLANHGRKVCIARKPKCFECAIADFCPGKKF